MPSMPPLLARPLELDLSAMGQPELAEMRPVSVFPGVRSHLNLTFASTPGFRPLLLDLHLPDAPTEVAIPVVLYAHGGGFFTGLKSMGPWRFLLDAGYAVASVDYRLSGECQFPGPVQDIAAAIRFLRSSSETFGLDPGRVVGFGSSAGAYLVSMVALGQGDDAILGRLGPSPDEPCTLAAVIDHYGVSDFLHLDSDARDDVVEISDAPGSSATDFLGYIATTRPEEAARASLLDRASMTAPPFLIFHGDKDRRVGLAQSVRLHSALESVGVKPTLVVVPGADHGSPHFDAPDVHDRTLAFLAAALDPATPHPTAISTSERI